jgi:hypothetical protein
LDLIAPPQVVRGYLGQWALAVLAWVVTQTLQVVLGTAHLLVAGLLHCLAMAVQVPKVPVTTECLELRAGVLVRLTLPLAVMEFLDRVAALTRLMAHQWFQHQAYHRFQLT